MRKIDIFISSPEDVQAERSLAERSIRSIAAEFCVPVTITYSNWLRRIRTEDKLVAQTANVREEGRSWLCPCFWEYQDYELDQDYWEQIPNTGSYDLVISILWSRLGTRISPAFIMPDGSRPRTVNDYEIAWVLDQLNRTPGFPELRVYRNRSTPTAPPQPKEDRETVFRQWDAVREFYSGWEKESTFAEACSDYSDLEAFENLFREHFRDFLARQLEKEVVPRKRLSKAPYWKPNPYRGLRCFDFEHASSFHGRTKAVGEVLDALKKQASGQKPFVLVLGTCGSGKSSLVRAGVLPLLTEVGTGTGNGLWRYAVARPGPGGTSGDPFDALAVALLAKNALPELQEPASRNEWRKVAAELREHPESVTLRVKELLDRISLQELDRVLDEQEDLAFLPGRIENVELARHRKLRRVKPKAQLALVVDQFEDLFVSGFSPELQQRYIALLAALVRTQRVFVIAALRSDFYASYQQFPELVELVGLGGRVDLLPPTRSELRSIIRLPAEAAGLSFERDTKANRSLDEALTDAAVVCSEPLPLLEHLLSELHRKQLDREDGLLRWCDYRELGEFSGALANHAESVFTALSSDAQQTFEFLMRRLVSLGPDGKALCRPIPYQDLVSSPELDNRFKIGAKSLVDCLVESGLFSMEADPRQEIFISVAHSALLRGWPRVQRWLAEDQEFLRMRDRVDGCLKLWLNRGRQSHHLLSPGSGLADGETLINHFHDSLSGAQIDYIRRSIAAPKRGRRIRNIVAPLVLVALAALVAVVGVERFGWDSQRRSLDEFKKLEGKIAELTLSADSAIQNAAKNTKETAEQAERRAVQAAAELGEAQIELKKSEETAAQARQRADLAASERTAMEARLKSAQDSANLTVAQRTAIEAQLKQAEEKAQRSADLAMTERTAMEANLKEAEEKAGQAQQRADLAAAQRSAVEAKLKQAEEEAQKARESADLAATRQSTMEAELKSAQESANLATTRRAEIEARLKEAEEKARQAQQSADLATTQRTAMEVGLKEARQSADLAVKQGTVMEATLRKTEEKAQQAQQSADLAATQRMAMETELKEAEEKTRQAQRNADLAATERTAMEARLKEAEEKTQPVRQSADLAMTERTAMEARLKEAEEKVQRSQQSVVLATTDRTAMEARLKEAEEKAQQVQQSAGLATAERAAMEAELKEAEEKVQRAQQSADLATTQRTAMEARLKEAEEKAHLAERTADLAATQRAAAEAQLKEAEEKARLAQQSADLGTSQRGAMEAQMKQAEEKAQLAQKNADLASTQRSAMELQLKEVEEKAKLAQKIAESDSAQSNAVENGSSKGDPVKKGTDIPPNQTGSGRALPLDAGQNAEPVIPTQPLLAPVQSANH